MSDKSNRKSKQELIEDISGALKEIERLKVENARLKELQEQYDKLADNIRDGLTVIEKGKVVYVNKRMEQITGYSFEEMRRLNPLEWVAPEDRATIDYILRKIQAGCGAPEELEFCIIRKGGERRRIQNRYSQFKNEEGYLSRFVVTEDVTEKRRTEAALSETEDLYRHIFDNVNDAIYVHDYDTFRVIDVNRKATEIFKCSREAFLNLSAEMTMLDEAPYRPQEAMALLQKARDGEPQLFLWKTKTAEGETVWLEMNLKKALIGKKWRLLAVARDVTERINSEVALRNSEELFRAVSESASSVICIIQDEKFCYVNPAFERITKYSKEEVIGTPFFAGTQPENQGKVREFMRKRLEGGLEVGLDEFPIKTKSGETKWMNISTAAIDYKGRQAILCSAFDVTDRKLTMDELKAAHRELESKNHLLEMAVSELKTLDQRKVEFLANISHELRTPLVALQGYLELMTGEELGAITKEQARALSISRENVIRLGSLIENLLTFSTVEENRKRMKSDLCDMNSVVSDAIALIEPLAMEQKLRLKMNLFPTPLHFTGDTKMMERAVINVLSNAVKFNNPEGEVSVEVGLDANHIKVSVSDTGIGIDAEKLPRIFDRFYQADSSKTRKYGGVGIGLAITKDIVALHGGEIRASSEKGKGSRIEIVIPCQR